MVTSRSKRWNGSVDALPVEFLNGVLAKMVDYGDRVQFSLISAGPQPTYQVMNSFGKAMAFDRNHHLMQELTQDFIGMNAGSPLTIDQIRLAISGVSIGGRTTATRARSTGTARAATGTRTTAAKLDDQFASARYEYFKVNREMLPAGISKHSSEIAALMKQGKTVEAAFDEISTKYF